MELLTSKNVLLGLLSLALLACDKEEPLGGPPSEKFPGNWGVCFESTRCESVLDDGYMISEKSISKVELSGYEHTEHQSAECGKCVKTGFISWTYERVTTDVYSLQGDSISFTPGPGEEVTIKLSGSGRIVNARIHLRGNDVDTVMTEYWTRLAGTFTPL